MICIVSLVLMSGLFVISCNSPTDGEFSNSPTDEVNVSEDTTYTVDFRCDFCESLMFEVLPNEFSELKTRNDLINYYKNLRPSFLPSYSSMTDINQLVFARVEYMLAQECFNDNCGSNIRKDVLQLVVDKQKSKWEQYTSPDCTQKTGVFLMAVILLKERENTVKFIDSTTLQKALKCLSNETLFVSKDFSDLIIDCSVKFLNNN